MYSGSKTPLLTDAAPSSRSAMPEPDAARAACGLGPPVKLFVARIVSWGAELRRIGYERVSKPNLNMWLRRNHDVLARYWKIFEPFRSSATMVPICPMRFPVTSGNVVIGLPAITLSGKPRLVGLKLRLDEVRLD
jgi:hypothetical protein